MEKQYDNEKTGFLWHETNSKVMRKGTLTLDGKKHYVAIVESHNSDGQPKYEFMVSAGLLHINEEHKKVSANSPDIGGAVSLALADSFKTYKLGGWKKISKNNQEYTSISIKEKEEEQDQVTKEEPDMSHIPF
tara:strand:+ start:634 stop:1032 length:399 start_codon:yes stop_codon:yes gene_type:complete